MKRNLSLLCLILHLLLSSCPTSTGTTNNGTADRETTGISPEQNDFHHADGRFIVDGSGQKFLIRGIAFGNEVWSNPAVPPKTHHGEIDYQRASAMGFNCIRFYLNYRIFEEDSAPFKYKQSGFDWIDKNLAWAKKNNIKLILNMHYPQGGFQSLGNGDALWDVQSNRKRLIALWTEIARRYADEPTIIAYDLLNEPVVTKSIDQWINLADEITRSIRHVDSRHIIIVERMNANENLATDRWNPDQNGRMNFFLLNDRNIVYEFHTYVPMDFTHQGAVWIPSLKDIRSVWPDPARMETSGGLTWNGATFANPALTRETENWQYFQGIPYTVSNSFQKIGRPALQGSRIKNGIVWFDDLTLTETDPSGNITNTWNWDLNTHDGFYYWSSPEEGSGSWSETEGRNNTGCWAITGSGADAVLSDNLHSITLKQGYSYAISGWMKGRNLPTEAAAKIRLDLYTSPGEIYSWDRRYLEAEINRYLAFSQKYDVPLYLGEFGCTVYAFEKNRGGLIWVSDIIDICTAQGIGYNYHTWHETFFGVFRNNTNELPAEPNQPLIELFTKKQKN